MPKSIPDGIESVTIIHAGKPVEMKLTEGVMNGIHIVRPVVFIDEDNLIGVGVIPAIGLKLTTTKPNKPYMGNSHLFFRTGPPCDIITLLRTALVFESLKELNLKIAGDVINAVSRTSLKAQKRARKALRKVVKPQVIQKVMNRKATPNIIQIFLSRYALGDVMRAASISEELVAKRLQWEFFYDLYGIPHPDENISGELIEHALIADHVHTIENYSVHIGAPMQTMIVDMICLELVRSLKEESTESLPFSTLFVVAVVRATGKAQHARRMAESMQSEFSRTPRKPAEKISEETPEQTAVKICMWLAGNDQALAEQYLQNANKIIDS